MTKRLAFLVNPTSGRGKLAGSADAVADRLGTGGYDVTQLAGDSAQASADLASKVVSDGYDALVVMGGDGMAHLALQALSGSSVPLGIVATGTGNDIARALGIPLRKPLDAADIVVGGHTRRMDLGRVSVSASAEGAGSSAVFATVLAAGFDSLVNERANAMTWPTGQMRYNLATLAELRVFKPRSYVLELDGEPMSCEAMLVAVGNCPTYGGGLRMCEGAQIDDGLLDVAVIRPVSKLELLKVYPKLFKGTHVNHPAYERHRVRSVRIAADGIVAYADGERLGPLPATVDVMPAAVTVFSPAT